MGIKTRSRLHGGVVTQRIANPLSPIDFIGFFLTQTALPPVNRGRICNTLLTGAAALALAGCGLGADYYGVEEDAREAAAFAAKCVTYASPETCREHCLLLADYESAQIQCLHVIGQAMAAAPDPAPDLAGGPEVAP